MGKWADLSTELERLLRLRNYPIGYKRLEKVEELEEIPGVIRLDQNKMFTFCQMINMARRIGLTVGATNKDRMFSHCAQIHGLQAVPPTRTGAERLRWVRTEEDGRKRQAAFTRIPPGEAIVLAPLVAEKFEPDVAWIYANPAQVIMIIQALIRLKFERYQFYCIGESSCNDSLAECYVNGRVSLGVPGIGERALGQVEDDEMALALPPAEFERALVGLREFAEMGIRYPIPHSGADVDVRPGLARSYPDDPEFKP